VVNAPGLTVRRALAGLELAALRHRGAVRRHLGVGDDELCALLHLAHHGGTSQRELAAATTLSRSGAAAMLQRLEHHGLVHRRGDPGDRRRRLVELTPAGRDRLDSAYARLDASLRGLLDARPADELTALAALLDALGHAAEPTAATAPPIPAEPIWRRWG
jgi:DNA-binding MarR family transcriptional regulator